MPEHFLLRNRDTADINQLPVYLELGGFRSFRTVVTSRTPQDVVQLVRSSGLRGRGGAGFPTGVKWGFLSNGIYPRYVVANADESEPGTFKDREILEMNPFQFLEGVAICAYAAEANTAYIYCRGEFWDLAHALENRIEELYERDLLGGKLFGTDYHLNIHVALGAGAYICGEETALLESLEGKLGQPRLRPPFPAAEGLFGKPTVINNVETLTNLPPIIEKGPVWFRSYGTEKSPGMKIFSLSGRVKKPGNYELPFGTTFRELIHDHGGGIMEDRMIKAIMPAGSSSMILPATGEVLDTAMDYESVKQLGSALGSASVIVIDDSVDMKRVLYRTARFFKHESCGKCTPCREGTYWMYKLLQRMDSGNGRQADVELLESVARGIQGKCMCALGEFSTAPVLTALEHFPDDFQLEDNGIV